MGGQMAKAATIRLKRIAIGMTLIFGFTACSASKPVPEDTSASNQEKGAVYKDLSAKYKQLFQQNQELRKMFQKLETDKQAEKEQSEKTIKQLTNTITLLELNLKQMNDHLNSNSKQLDQLATKQAKPAETVLPTAGNDFRKETGPVAGFDSVSSVSDFKTPDSSKAIKTIPLFPNSKPVVKADSPVPSVEKTKSVEINKATEENYNSAVLPINSNSAWQDPDLVPPASPIQLKIIPGAKKNYQEAFKSYSNREYKESIKLFGEFIKQYPNDLDADNSQYWIGAAYYVLEDYTNAETAFRKVLKNYPHKETKQGFKTPDAILMLGRIYSNRDQPIKSRYYFEELVKQFPDSISAAKAKREIQSMSGF
jgi:tol-pal system protein YbgF